MLKSTLLKWAAALLIVPAIPVVAKTMTSSKPAAVKSAAHTASSTESPKLAEAIAALSKPAPLGASTASSAKSTTAIKLATKTKKLKTKVKKPTALTSKTKKLTVKVKPKTTVASKTVKKPVALTTKTKTTNSDVKAKPLASAASSSPAKRTLTPVLDQ
jgi:hypothetical protein